jgi:hypothetical protein
MVLVLVVAMVLLSAPATFGREKDADEGDQPRKVEKAKEKAGDREEAKAKGKHEEKDEADEDGKAKAKQQEAQEENEEKVSIHEVPAAVGKKLRLEAMGEDIQQVDKQKLDGKTVYEADVMIDGHNYEILVDGKGVLISKKLDEEAAEKAGGKEGKSANARDEGEKKDKKSMKEEEDEKPAKKMKDKGEEDEKPAARKARKQEKEEDDEK